MDMKRFNKLVMFSVLAVVMAPSLPAKEVLGAGYHPTTERTANDTVHGYAIEPGDVLLSAEEIAQIIPNAAWYSTMEPELKRFVDKNKENYFSPHKNTAVLYRNLEAGFQIIMNHNGKDYGGLYLDRLRFDKGDAAWEYPKTKAVNPKTKKPWIALDKKTLAKIQKDTGQKFSKEDIEYIRDVLSIINENFHFYYGMPFATPERDFAAFKKTPGRKGKTMKDYKASLMGHLLPRKIMTFKPAGIEELYGDESEQRKAISQKLGRPVYDVLQLFKEDNGEDVFSNHCGGEAVMAFNLKDGQGYQFPYFNSVNAEDIKPDTGRRQLQVLPAVRYFGMMEKGLEQLMADEGVDVHSLEGNTTPRTQALYHINLKARNYLHAVMTHPYVTESKKGKYQDNFEGKKALYEAVPLPTKMRSIEELQQQSNQAQNVTPQQKHPAMCFVPQHTR